MHIDDRTMWELIEGELTGEPRQSTIQHIQGCMACAKRMKVLMGLNQMLGEALDMFHQEQCPGIETLCAYSENQISDENHAEVEKHLQICAVCSMILEDAKEAVFSEVGSQQP